MDPVSGYSKSRLLVKEHVSLKSKSDWAMHVSGIFAIPVFYFDQSAAHQLGFG